MEFIWKKHDEQATETQWTHIWHWILEIYIAFHRFGKLVYGTCLGDTSLGFLHVPHAWGMGVWKIILSRSYTSLPEAWRFQGADPRCLPMQPMKGDTRMEPAGETAVEVSSGRFSPTE
ncbi:hypothetical protein TcCL_NonESM06659 [Trypanosoma cruzi]|nr:hypothetical protein TcCL_NonESM06659 [Trypanosoma cruzi]